METYTSKPLRRLRILKDMAQLHSDLPPNVPGHFGEFTLAKQLLAMCDDKFHFWFGVNSIPGVSDIDMILWHEEAGVFVIEVKAVGLGAIEVFERGKCKIRGREEGKNPAQQALTALNSLLNFLRTGTALWLTAVSCWPIIQRRTWIDWFRNSPDFGEEYAARLLLNDDLYSTQEVLLKQLTRLRTDPVIGTATNRPFRHSHELLAQVQSAISPKAKPEPVPSDLERLQVIERRIATSLRTQFPPKTASRVLFTGKPGTGKTFRLLQVAMYHAANDCRVLYLCFNKVLATDIRRLLSFSKTLSISNGTVEVFDVFDFLRNSAYGDLLADGDHDDWAQLVVEQMKADVGKILVYDTVLLDEAQDLKQWVFELVDIVSTSKSSVLIAHGRGQELYQPAASVALSDIHSSALYKKQNLPRNFRNMEATMKVARAFYECDARHDRLVKLLPALRTSVATLYERPGGRLPTIVLVDDSPLESCDPLSYPDEQEALMTAEYSRIIQQELLSLNEQQRAIDILLLVPGEKANERRWVVQALQALQIGYIDYTIDCNRHSFATPNELRLCTFKSARGIEGQKVIVLGVDKLASLVAGNDGIDKANLGYIVLSRASVDMSIVSRKGLKSPDFAFIAEVVTQLA